jgi:GTP-binding protein
MIRDYLLKRKNLLTVFVLVDSRLEPQKIDLEFINWLGEKQVPFSIVFTKSDKLKKLQIIHSVEHYKKELRKRWKNCHRCSLPQPKRKPAATRC